MSKQRWFVVLWAILLIIVGIVALAYDFGVFDNYKLVTTYAISGVLAIMGLGFLAAILFQKEQWFYVIPGFSLLSLAGVVFLTTLENVRTEWMGALFLGGIALGFLVIFLRQRQERWWALLQAETIFIIALVGLGVGVPESATGLVGAILFGGFALSFFFVWLLSGNRSRFVWALILSGVLMIFAAVIFTAEQGRVWQLAWPIVALILGVMLLTWAVARTKKTAPAVPIETIQEPGLLIPEEGAEPAKILPPSEQQPQEPAEPVAPLPEPEIIPEPEPAPDESLPPQVADIIPQDLDEEST